MVWGWVKSFKSIQRHLLRQGFPSSIRNSTRRKQIFTNRGSLIHLGLSRPRSHYARNQILSLLAYTRNPLLIGTPDLKFWTFICRVCFFSGVELYYPVQCIQPPWCCLFAYEHVLLLPFCGLLSFSGCGTLSLDVNKTWLLLLAPPQLARLVSGKNLELWAFRLWHHLFSLLWPG